MDIETLSDQIAKNIKELLDEKGLNPSGVAKAASLGHTSVKDIITRKTKHPTYATLLKIAEVAEVDILRITIGPNYRSVSSVDQKLYDLFSQLQPEERQLLINVANQQIASRNQSD